MVHLRNRRRRLAAIFCWTLPAWMKQWRSLRSAPACHTVRGWKSGPWQASVQSRVSSRARLSSLPSKRSAQRHAIIDKRRRVMCPFCLANLAFIAASAVSTSGLGALAVEKFFFEPNRNRQPNETGERQDEMETLEPKTDMAE